MCSGASHTVACSPTRQVSPLPPPRPLGPAAAAPAGSPRSLGRRRQAWLSHRVGQPKCEGISHEYVPRVTRSQHRANPVPPVKKNCSEPAADSADSADGAGGADGADGADGAFHSRARHGGRPGGAGGPEAAVCKTEKNRSAPHGRTGPPRLVTVRWGQSPRLSRLTAQGPAGHTPGHQSGEGNGKGPVKSRCQPRPRAPGSAGLRGCGGRDSAFLRSSRGAGLVRTLAQAPTHRARGRHAMRGVDRRAAAVPTRSGERGVRLPPPPAPAHAWPVASVTSAPPRGARTCSGPGLALQ